MVGASVGNRGLILPHHLPALRNQNMWCFRPIANNGISKVYAKHLLDTLIVEKISLASGSAREFFRKGDFQNHLVLFGTSEIQDAFNEIATPLSEKLSYNTAQIDHLATLRDALLPKLLSGEIQIPEAEQQLAEVI
jgi:type I restriction enzyme S subunit